MVTQQVISNIRNGQQLDKFIDMFNDVKSNKAEDIINMIDYFNTSNSVPESLHLIRMQAAMNDENFMSDFNKLLGFEKLLTLIDRMQSKIEYAGLIPYCQQPVRSFSINVDGQTEVLDVLQFDQCIDEENYSKIILNNVSNNTIMQELSPKQKIILLEQQVLGLISILKSIQEQNSKVFVINQQIVIFSLYKLMLETHNKDTRETSVLLLNSFFDLDQLNTITYSLSSIEKYALINNVKSFQPLFNVLKTLIASDSQCLLEQVSLFVFALFSSTFNPDVWSRLKLVHDFSSCANLNSFFDQLVQKLSVYNKVLHCEKTCTTSQKKALSCQLSFQQFSKDSQEVKDLAEFFRKDFSFEGHENSDELLQQATTSSKLFSIILDVSRALQNDVLVEISTELNLQSCQMQGGSLPAAFSNLRNICSGFRSFQQSHLVNSINLISLLFSENKKDGQAEPLLLSLVALSKFVEKLLIFARTYNQYDTQVHVTKAAERIARDPIFTEDVFQLLASGEVRDNNKIVSYMEFMFDQKVDEILKQHWEMYSRKKKQLMEDSENLKQSEQIELQRQLIQRGSMKIVPTEFYLKHKDADKVMEEKDKSLREKVQRIQFLSLQLADLKDGNANQPQSSSPDVSQQKNSAPKTAQSRLASATLISNNAMMFANQLKKQTGNPDFVGFAQNLAKGTQQAVQPSQYAQKMQDLVEKDNESSDSFGTENNANISRKNDLSTKLSFAQEQVQAERQDIQPHKPVKFEMPTFLQPNSILQKPVVGASPLPPLPSGPSDVGQTPVNQKQISGLKPPTGITLPPPVTISLPPPPQIKGLPPPGGIVPQNYNNQQPAIPKLPPPPAGLFLPPPPAGIKLPGLPTTGVPGLPPPPSATGLPPHPGNSCLPPPPGKIGLPPPPGSSVLPPPPGAGGLPPPPGMGGLPPPPGAGLPGMAAPQPQPQRAVVNVVPKDVKLKNFFWDKLRANDIKEFHIWKDVGRTDYKLDVETLQLLISQFEDKKKYLISTTDQVQATQSAEKPANITFLDGKKQQQIGICIQKMRLSPQQIKSRIFQMKNLLTNEHGIELLLSACPTSEEFALAKSALEGEKNIDKYGVPEQFVALLLEVPNYQKRIENWLYCKSFDIELMGKKPVFVIFNKLFDFLLNGLAWKETLKILLTIGNILTANTAKGEAYGMKLKSLVSFAEFKDRDGKIMLQHVVKIIQRFDQQRAQTPAIEAANELLANQLADHFAALSFTDFDYPLIPQLKVFISIMDQIKKQNFEEESKEFDAFASQLAFIGDSFDQFQTDQDEDRYCEVVSDFVQVAADQANTVAGMKNCCLENYKLLLLTYGENINMKLHDFLVIVTTFADSLKSSLAAVEQEGESARKLLLKEQKDQVRHEVQKAPERPLVEVSKSTKAAMDSLLTVKQAPKKTPTKPKANPLMSCTILIQ